MEPLYAGLTQLFVFVIGASIGSFLNVVIYRLPAGLSILHPPSRCPVCLHRLKLYDNVPVLGWLWLRGRCRYCYSPLSIRYPLVEAATGILFVVTFRAFDQPLPAMGYWVFFSALLALALIDLDTMTLPGSLTRLGVVTGLIFQVVWGGSLGGVGMVNQLMIGIIGAVVGIWLFDWMTVLATYAFGQPAMGGGDAKLAAMMGAWLGWQWLLLASFLACVLGAFIGGGAIALKLISRRQPIPFGPFLAIGAILVTFWGEKILATYRSIFFPTF
jgi:leader peptidase (prepilin peptidase)/N-methyltransferase